MCINRTCVSLSMRKKDSSAQKNAKLTESIRWKLGDIVPPVPLPVHVLPPTVLSCPVLAVPPLPALRIKDLDPPPLLAKQFSYHRQRKHCSGADSNRLYLGLNIVIDPGEQALSQLNDKLCGM